jgi:hypothetical protein
MKIAIEKPDGNGRHWDYITNVSTDLSQRLASFLTEDGKSMTIQWGINDLFMWVK